MRDPTGLLDLPRPLLETVFQCLVDTPGSSATLCKLSCVCRTFHHILSSDQYWYDLGLLEVMYRPVPIWILHETSCRITHCTASLIFTDAASHAGSLYESLIQGQNTLLTVTFEALRPGVMACHTSLT